MGKNSYEYTGINTSATAAFPAGTDLTDIGAKAGAEFARGTLLATDKDGLCQEASAGQWVCARALASASEKGSLIRVQIIHAGQMAQTANTP